MAEKIFFFPAVSRVKICKEKIRAEIVSCKNKLIIDTFCKGVFLKKTLMQS